MPHTVQQTLQDPNFYGLPPGEQQKVLATLDPNYARLPLQERNKVLQMGQQRLGAASGDTSPAATPPVLKPPSLQEKYDAVTAPYTEIQQPDSNDRWSYKEGLKAMGNIGSGAMGMVLHPIDTAKAFAAPLAAMLPSYASGPLGIPIPVPNQDAIPFGTNVVKSFAKNPYGMLEAGIGQAAVAEAAPEAAAGMRSVAEGGVRRLVGSGPGVARDLVRQATEANRVIDLHNFDKQAEAQQNWEEKQAKANADHKAELLRLRQKYEQDQRDALETARTGTAEDRAQYQAKQLAAKQKYDQAVRDAKETHANAVAEAQQANAEEQRKFNQNIGKTVQQNREAGAAERAKADQADRLPVVGSQLMSGLRQLDKALRDRAAVMYDAIREKVGNASLPGTGLAQAARAAISNIKGTSVTPTVFRDILGKYPEAEPETINYQGTQVPRGTPLYDVLAQHGAVEAPPVTYADLQGYYSELGGELSKGTLPDDVYLATRALQESVGGMMQDLADKAGVGKQLTAARVFYRKYMDTFHEPTGPSSSGSPIAQALLAKDPLVAVDKFASDSGERGIADLRRYSDSLANLAQEAQRVARTKISVPERKSVADIKSPATTPVPVGANLPLPPIQESAPTPRAANLPLPPVIPEAERVPFRQPKLTPRHTISAGDLQRANEAAVRARAAGLAGHLFWWTGVWPAFRMLSELARGAEVSLKPLALMPAAGAAGMATEELMAQPAVVDFLTRATRQQVAQIPPDLRGAIPDIVALAGKRGVQVSPILAAYAATVQRNQRQQGSQQ